jgi:hypothetical protein
MADKNYRTGNLNAKCDKNRKAYVKNRSRAIMFNPKAGNYIA